MDNPKESMTLVMYGDMPLYLKTMVGSCSWVTNKLHQLKLNSDNSSHDISLF